MIYFENQKEADVLKITFNIQFVDFSKTIVINFTISEMEDIELCKSKVHQALPSRIRSNARCKAINHLVASINDFKKRRL